MITTISGGRAWLAATAIGAVCAAILCSSGCGALGLYSLGHSLLGHHHVFKPVLPDEPVVVSDDPPLMETPHAEAKADREE